MPGLTALYVDFTDLRSYRAWRWLSLLPEHRCIEVRPFSLDAEAGAPVRPWDRDTSSTSLELLALGELARTAGRQCHQDYVDAAFAAVHEADLDLDGVEGWLELSAEVGLDLDAFVADGDRWRAEVGLWHAEAVDDLGVDDVPTLVVDDEHAFSVTLSHTVTGSLAARQLLDDLLGLVRYPVAAIRRHS